MGDQPWNRREGWFDQPRHRKIVGAPEPAGIADPVTNEPPVKPKVDTRRRRTRG